MAASLVLLVVSLCASAFPVSAGAVRGASPVDEMMKNQEFLYHWLEREYKFRPSHKGRQVPKDFYTQDFAHDKPALITKGRFPLDQLGVKGFFPYKSNKPIDKPNNKIHRIFIALHGIDCCGTWYNYAVVNMTQMIATMEHSQKVPEETLVIAPQMLTGYCMAGIDYPGVIHWYGHCGAGSADDSIVDGKDVGLSLYKIYDALIEKIVAPDLFPNLKKVVMTGYSASQSFIAEYAVRGNYKSPPGRKTPVQFQVFPGGGGYCAVPGRESAEERRIAERYANRYVVYFGGDLEGMGPTLEDCKMKHKKAFGSEMTDKFKKFYLVPDSTHLYSKALSDPGWRKIAMEYLPPPAAQQRVDDGAADSTVGGLGSKSTSLESDKSTSTFRKYFNRWKRKALRKLGYIKRGKAMTA